MKIALGSDHAGYAYKERIKEHLCSLGYQPVDFGTFAPSPDVDYPDFIRPAAEAVAAGSCDAGIVFGGSGNGEAMAANKVRGIRAAMCHDLTTARSSREHNDANVLTLGGKILQPAQAAEITLLWLTTDFAGGRHWPRVNKIMALERGGR